MSEVLEIMSKVILLLGLFYFAWQDYKTNMLGLFPLLGFALCGMGIRFFMGNFFMIEFAASMVVGVVSLFISLITSESLGIGDGLLFLGTGMFLESMENFALFCGALLLAGGFSGICLVLKKKNRKDKIPLVPFVYMAYVIFVL